MPLPLLPARVHVAELPPLWQASRHGIIDPTAIAVIRAMPGAGRHNDILEAESRPAPLSLHLTRGYKVKGQVLLASDAQAVR
jgi:hypothetical protein